MADIVESWLWQPPDAEMVDRLRARAVRHEQRVAVPQLTIQQPEHQRRDRYYTQARRLHVRQVMREQQ